MPAIFIGMATRRDFKAMEKRRFRAMTLLEKGLSQAEVARRTKVSRQSVLRWNRQRLAGGQGGDEEQEEQRAEFHSRWK